MRNPSVARHPPREPVINLGLTPGMPVRHVGSGPAPDRMGHQAISGDRLAPTSGPYQLPALPASRCHRGISSLDVWGGRCPVLPTAGTMPKPASLPFNWNTARCNNSRCCRYRGIQNLRITTRYRPPIPTIKPISLYIDQPETRGRLHLVSHKTHSRVDRLRLLAPTIRDLHSLTSVGTTEKPRMSGTTGIVATHTSRSSLVTHSY